MHVILAASITVSGKLQGFLVQLRQDDNETAQLDALSQLNELLSISNEESLSVFPVEQLVPVLVRSFRTMTLTCCTTWRKACCILYPARILWRALFAAMCCWAFCSDISSTLLNLWHVRRCIC